MRILHGENTLQSRNQLLKYTAAAREQGKLIQHVDAKSLDRPSLEQLLGSESLFAEPKLIVIEELQSLPKSKKKDELIDMLGQRAGESSETIELIVWEKRDLTATMLKKFPSAQTEQFKLSSSLFTWLDSLSGQKNTAQTKRMIELLDKALQSDGDFMCFSMLTRQIRLLIQTKDNALGNMAPFMIGKLKKQGTTFTFDQLLNIHHRLLTLDTQQKTSTTRLSMSQELEVLMVEM
jgi:hypothetical protein